MEKDTRNEEMSNIPRHIGFVPDGNRRFAKRLMINPWKGHEFGAQKVRKLLYWCKDIGVHELTLFAFSLDNFHRPPEEFTFLMNLFEREFSALKESKEIFDEKLQINFIGRIDLFPERIVKIMEELMNLTKDHDGFIVNFAMAYGGRAEIIDAARRLAEDVERGVLPADHITEKAFQQYLGLKTNVDMIIRTGGEKRTSGFLLWQGEYSELFFVDKLWPEFEKEDFLYCIEEFKHRQRRFGC